MLAEIAEAERVAAATVQAAYERGDVDAPTPVYRRPSFNRASSQVASGASHDAGGCWVFLSCCLFVVARSVASSSGSGGGYAPHLTLTTTVSHGHTTPHTTTWCPAGRARDAVRGRAAQAQGAPAERRGGLLDRGARDGVARRAQRRDRRRGGQQRAGRVLAERALRAARVVAPVRPPRQLGLALGPRGGGGGERGRLLHSGSLTRSLHDRHAVNSRSRSRPTGGASRAARSTGSRSCTTSRCRPRSSRSATRTRCDASLVWLERKPKRESVPRSPSPRP